MSKNQEKDYYARLGVPRAAAPAEIEAAFRRLIRKYHPDVNPGDPAAVEQYEEIMAAYSILGDERKRALFDRHGYYDPAEDAESSSETNPTPEKRTPAEVVFEGFDLSEMDRSFGDVIDRILGPSPSGSAEPDARGKGDDIEVPLAVTFEEALKGLETSVTVSRLRPCGACHATGLTGGPASMCPACAGTGKRSVARGGLRLSSSCEECKGTGQRAPNCPVCQGPSTGARVWSTEQVGVKLPPGVDSGSKIRIPGEGSAGPFGGAASDLYVVTQVGVHPFFTRKGENLYCTVPVTLTEAILGTHIEIPTVGGPATLRVPPGCQSGQVFRLREKGFPSLRGEARGDQYVEIKVVIPRVADARSRELLEEFNRLNPDNPREAWLRPPDADPKD